MKKKAILLNNTLSFLLAVVGLLLFIFASYKVYQIANKDNDSENARALLDILIEKINTLEESKPINVTLQGMLMKEPWFITGWSKNDRNAPEKCFFSSCICVCPDLTSESCQAGGFCRSIDKEEIKVETRLFILMNDPFNPKEIIEVLNSFNQIPLQENLMQIEVEKKNNLLKINYLIREDDTIEVQ